MISISQFWLGAGATLAAEMALLLVWGMVMSLIRACREPVQAKKDEAEKDG